MINPSLLRAFINDCNEFEWRIRLCPGLPMSNGELAKLWAGRPKGDGTRYTRYFFILGVTRQYVNLQPSRYIPVDWRGLL